MGIGLRVFFLNVGQGDTTVVITPGGHVIVVDCFNHQKTCRLLRALGVKEVDVFVTTHPHHDHICGAPSLLEKFIVNRWIDPQVSPHSPYMETCLELAEQGRVRVCEQARSAGKTEWTDDGTYYHVLAPSKALVEALNGMATQPGYSLNDYSVVVKIGFKDHSGGFVLGSDAEIFNWAHMLSESSENDLCCSVVKVPHHGSPRGAYFQLYERMECTHFVLSYGVKNTHGHPHPITELTLDKLVEIGKAKKKIWRTATDGTIYCVLDRKGHVEITPLGDTPDEDVPIPV